MKDAKPGKPVSAGAISTADAAKKINEKVTVELTVQATGGRGNRLFLNSEKNFRDAKNFTIVLDMPKAGEKFKAMKIDEPLKYYTGKTLQVTGTVAEYMGRGEIIVSDPEQIKVINKE